MWINARFACPLIVVLLIGSALAQDSEIQGLVTDSSQSLVPGAEVVVTNSATAVTRTTVSNDQGFYSVPLLKAGQYTVKCSSSGFKAQETSVALQVGQVARINFQLEVGQVNQVIEVTAKAAQLQSKTTDVGQVIDERRIEDLPLNGRNYLELAQLSAGVTRSAQAGRGHRGAGEGAFQSAGIHIAQNNILLDGVDNSSRISTVFNSPLTFQVQAVKPSVDAVSEFKVITNNVSAEHGYRMGAKVLVSTKSGTNDFHGSLFEFHRNDALGANNFFFNRNNQEAPQFIRNQFGGTIGGPIIRNRTFFFFSYEGTRLRRGLSGAISSVPSQEVRNGNFSLQPDTRRNIFDPLTTVGEGTAAVRQQFPDNTIPQNRWDPVGAQLLAFYPLPNIAGRENLPNNYFGSPGLENDADGYDVRVDHNFSDAHRIFGRFSHREQDVFEPPQLPAPAFGNSGLLTSLEAQNVAINYNATISSSMLNELRFGFSRLPSAFDLSDPSAPTNQSIGLSGPPTVDEPGTALFAVDGFSQLGPPGDTPKRDSLKGYHISDNLLWDRGRHSVKLGFEYRQTKIARQPAGWRRGWGRFRGWYTSEFPNVAGSRGSTGNAAADLLLGWGWGQVVGTPTGETSLAPYYGAYLQDDWRITNRLTLNLGLRYELFDGPYFPGAPGEQPQIARFLWTGDIRNETENQIPIEFAGFAFPEDGRDCGCRRDTNNFAPRIGLAYRLTDSTVIRTGAGLYYGEADSVAFDAGRFQEGPPNSVIEQFQGGNTIVPGFVLSDGMVPLAPPDPTVLIPGTSVRAIPEFLPQMYTGQWFLDIQHQLPWDVLMTFGYTGSSTSFLSWARGISNPLDPDPNVPANLRRRTSANLGNINLNFIDNILNANYNAFSFRTEKRFSDGLTFLSSFTWSKIIDYGQEIAINGAEGNGVSTQFAKDLFRNRGRANLDRTLVYNLSFLYELPAGPGKGRFESGPANWILGGWQVGGILSLLTGTPLDTSFTPDTINTGSQFRGDLVGDPNLPESERTVDRWFNTEAFAPTAVPGEFGNAGRGLVDAPGWKNFDFSLRKNFAMPWEGQSLQFRFESFNFTNTPHFGKPNLLTGSNPSAGVITNAEDARTMQFALRYVF